MLCDDRTLAEFLSAMCKCTQIQPSYSSLAAVLCCQALPAHPVQASGSQLEHFARPSERRLSL